MGAVGAVFDTVGRFQRLLAIKRMLAFEPQSAWAESKATRQKLSQK